MCPLISEQRIASDIESFVVNVTDLISLVIGKLLNSVAFMGVLVSISPFLAAFLLVYGLLGTLVVIGFFGPVLMRLKASVLKLKADFRHGLLRVREVSSPSKLLTYSGRLILVVRRPTMWCRMQNLSPFSGDRVIPFSSQLPS